MMPNSVLQSSPLARQTKTQISVYKHFICRVGGLPLAGMERLRAHRALTAAERWVELDGGLKPLAEPIADGLYTLIDGEEDRDLRRALLRLKRDAHNQRPLRDKDLGVAAKVLPAELRDQLDDYRRIFEQRRQAAQDVTEHFARELPEIRGAFQDAVMAEDFQRGLLLSSRSLVDQVPRYRKASLTNAGAKVRQIERSLMRYYSRTVLKSTPFSTFCTLIPGRLDEVEEPTFDGDPGKKVGVIRLNKTLYAFILRALPANDVIRKHLPLELNPTLDVESGGQDRRWVFLGARGQQEVFQRLPMNPVVALLIDEVRARGPVPWRGLVDRLCNHPDIEASEDEGAAYVDRLVRVGLFRYRLGIGEQEADWDYPLRDLLRPIEDPLAIWLVDFLGNLRQSAEAYERAPDPTRRRRHLDAANGLVKDLFERLEKKIGSQGPFYEDAGGEASLRLSLGPLEESLKEYVELSSRLAWPRSEQANMRHFFTEFYGDNGPPVPLLRFYEDYYREHFKAHLERQKQGPPAKPQGQEPRDQKQEPDGGSADTSPEPYNAQNPFDLDFIDQLNQGHKLLTGCIQERWRDNLDAEEIVLSRDDLAAAVEHLPLLEHGESGATAPISASLFTQFVDRFRDDGRPALVARSWLTGFGKYFSRFLYLMPEHLLADLRRHNRQLTDHVSAEICGDAKFNANLHPSVLPKEISYPTGESGEHEQQILSSDLQVELDPDNPQGLRLVRRSDGKRVIPVDLGFLNPRMRPPLFQLLSRFTPALNFNVQVPETPWTQETLRHQPPGERSRVRYRPRISYRGDLILARRQWWAGHGDFPFQTPEESAAAYFLRLQRWRRALGVPREAFVRITVLPSPPRDPAAEPSEGRNKGQAQHRRDGGTREHLYKPQYVDFGNPLLVDLLARTLETLDRFILVLEERLPAAEHLPQYGDDRYTCELIFQVDLPGGGP